MAAIPCTRRPAALLVALLAGLVTAAPPPGWTLTLEDTFEGAALNASLWSVASNMTHGPNELQLYLEDEVYLEGGALVLRTRRRSANLNATFVYNYTSGWVDMDKKFGQREGRWEVVAKLPDPACEAIWPAIWLMNCGAGGAGGAGAGAVAAGGACSGSEACWPTAGEVDILEMVGQQQNSSALGTYHWAKECGVDEYDGRQGVYPNVTGGAAPIDFSQAFHEFALEWNATSLSWFVDGQHVITRTTGDPTSLFMPPAPMYLILNTAVAWWFKTPPTWSQDVYFRIDSVRVYERTAPGTLF
jgi:beta-glucanase (GH16 family)